jgi:hypothetical protein
MVMRASCQFGLAISLLLDPMSTYRYSISGQGVFVATMGFWPGVKASWLERIVLVKSQLRMENVRFIYMTNLT